MRRFHGWQLIDVSRFEDLPSRQPVIARSIINPKKHQSTSIGIPVQLVALEKFSDR